jgi:hypothetical protein
LRQVLSWVLTFVIALAAVAGLVALINSRDPGALSNHDDSANARGRPYRGAPILSPADEDAVKRGNVVVLYRDERPPAGTSDLVPAGGAVLAQAGQSVLLDREPTLKTALAAVSAKRIQNANTPQELQPFIDYWLGGRP